MNSWHRNAFHITGPLWGESTGLTDGFPSQRANNADLCYLSYWLEQAVGWTVELPMIKTPWPALMGRHSNDYNMYGATKTGCMEATRQNHWHKLLVFIVYLSEYVHGFVTPCFVVIIVWVSNEFMWFLYPHPHPTPIKRQPFHRQRF